jgi:hypothetical protein
MVSGREIDAQITKIETTTLGLSSTSNLARKWQKIITLETTIR